MVIAIVLIAVLGYLFYYEWASYTTKAGAPYVPLEPDVVERIINLGEVTEKDVFYDLGSGDGRVVIAAAMKGAKAIGVETDLFRVLYSRFWIRIFRLEKRATIIHGDIFNQNYENATIVCTYLLQETNDKLKEKLEKELKKGTRIVSAAFKYEGWELIKVEPRGPIYGPLYLYKI